MQSIIALAGVVGIAAASYAPHYDDNLRATIQEAAFPTTYAASSVFRTVDAQLPAYSSPIDDDRFTTQPFYTESPRFTSPLIWSTTKYIRTSAYTTYCPEATTLSFNTKTYTITAATTLTVTDCYDGCAVVKPLPTTTIVQSAPVITTTQFETYCPEPTTLTFSAKTWTITEATTLTIPQTITTTSVFKTVIPIQPTYATFNSTIKTTYSSPAPTIEPFVPGTTPPAPVSPINTVPIVEPFVPGSSTEAQATIAPTTATYDAVVPPYPTTPSNTAVYYQPINGTGKVYPTASTVLYTGAGNRVGAGALMAIAGFVMLL